MQVQLAASNSIFDSFRLRRKEASSRVNIAAISANRGGGIAPLASNLTHGTLERPWRRYLRRKVPVRQARYARSQICRIARPTYESRLMRSPLRAGRALGISTVAACAVMVASSAAAHPSRAGAIVTVREPDWPTYWTIQTATRQPPPPPPIRVAAFVRRYQDGLSTGPGFDAYYGVVQVQAVIRGGRIESVNVLRQPSHSATSRSINRRALPQLEQEVITAQSANVHMVSGATLTSRAFIRSMSEALQRASG